MFHLPGELNRPIAAGGASIWGRYKFPLGQVVNEMLTICHSGANCQACEMRKFRDVATVYEFPGNSAKSSDPLIQLMPGGDQPQDSYAFRKVISGGAAPQILRVGVVSYVAAFCVLGLALHPAHADPLSDLVVDSNSVGVQIIGTNEINEIFSSPQYSLTSPDGAVNATGFQLEVTTDPAAPQTTGVASGGLEQKPGGARAGSRTSRSPAASPPARSPSLRAPRSTPSGRGPWRAGTGPVPDR